MPDEVPRKRLFFALWPDETTRANLVEATRAVINDCEGKAVPAANLHITLAFLHFVEITRLQCIRAAAERLTIPPFELIVDEIGRYKRAKILWSGPTAAPDPLQSLVTTLWRELEPCGFTPEVRLFTPHVTLLRKLRRSPRELSMTPVSWRVSSLALVESMTKPSGARYTVLQTWPLTGN